MATTTTLWRTHDVSYNSNTVKSDDHTFDNYLRSVPPKTKGTWVTLPSGHKFRRSTLYDRYEHILRPQIPQYGKGKWYEAVRNKWHDLEVETWAGGWRFDFVRASQLYSAFNMPDVGLTINGLNQSPTIPTASRNEAVVKALNELADGKANVGENLGTLGQTMRLICNPAQYLAKGLQKVFRDKALRPFIRESFRSLHKKGPLTFAAEQYLAYVYGWKPLIQDIQGLIELAQQKGELPLFVIGRGKSKHTQGVTPKQYSEPSHQSRNTVTGGQFDSTVRCTLYARIDPEHTGLRMLNQLGLANPLATAWELVSWSFVFDWFVPIGPVLSAMSAPAGLIFVDGSVSNRVTGIADFTSRYYGVDNKIVSSDGTGQIEYNGYRRDVIRSWPKAGFWVDPDPFRGDRLLKATALMIANIKTLG